MADLDDIMSGSGAAMPASDQTNDTAAPAAEQPPQGQPEPQSDPQAPEDVAAAMVPRAALEEERNKRRRYTDEVAALRQQYEQVPNLIQQSVQQALAQAFAQQQRAQQPPPPAPDFFQDPDAAVRYTVDPVIQQAVDPIRQQLMFNARLIAEQVNTREAVSEAQQAFDAALASRQLDPRDYERVMRSPNPFHEAVSWYNNRPERQQAQMEARLRQEIEAEVAARYQSQSAQPGGAPNLPSSFAAARSSGPRTGPGTTGPLPLSEIMKR